MHFPSLRPFVRLSHSGFDECNDHQRRVSFAEGSQKSEFSLFFSHMTRTGVCEVLLLIVEKKMLTGKKRVEAVCVRIRGEIRLFSNVLLLFFTTIITRQVRIL